MRRIQCILLTVLIPSLLLAGEGGSAYSIFGIGDIRYLPNARSAGMGCAGLALPTPSGINLLSPGSWSSITTTRAEGGFEYGGISAEQAGATSYRADGMFTLAAIGVPISPDNGMAFVGGFSRYSTLNYAGSANRTLQGDTYTLNLSGRGGINLAKVGLSYTPVQHLTLGASLDYFFGTLERTESLVPASTTIRGATTIERTDVSGIGGTVGAVFSGLGTITKPLDGLIVGGFISLPSTPTTETRFTYEFPQERDTSETTESSLSIPLAYGFGLGFSIDERHLLAADLSGQLWNDTELLGIKSTDLRNSTRFAVGAERVGARGTDAPWLDRISYRLGFAYSSTYYFIQGEPIHEWSVTGGLTTPVSGDTRLYWGIEFGNRGTMSNGLVKDTFWKLSLAVGISELWFVRFEDE